MIIMFKRFLLDEWTNERTARRTGERADERMNEQANEQTDERANGHSGIRANDSYSKNLINDSYCFSLIPMILTILILITAGRLKKQPSLWAC